MHSIIIIIVYIIVMFQDTDQFCMSNQKTTAVMDIVIKQALKTSFLFS